jgi:hypothetical protein
MNTKLMLGLSFIVITPLFGDAAEKLIEFKGLKAKWCNEWIQSMTDQAVKKAELLKKEHTEWSNFGQKAIKALNTAKDFEKNHDEWFSKQTKDAITLHKEHHAAWKKWAMEHQKACKELAARQEKQLKTFEDSLAEKESEEEESAEVAAE